MKKIFEDELIEPLEILAELILADSFKVSNEFAKSVNYGGNPDDLVWYMPELFIQALKKHYYRSLGMITVPNPPQLRGIEIRVGYEPRVVLTMKYLMAFTRPELTIRGQNLVKKGETE